MLTWDKHKGAVNLRAYWELSIFQNSVVTTSKSVRCWQSHHAKTTLWNGCWKNKCIVYVLGTILICLPAYPGLILQALVRAISIEYMMYLLALMGGHVHRIGLRNSFLSWINFLDYFINQDKSGWESFKQAFRGMTNSTCTPGIASFVIQGKPCPSILKCHHRHPFSWQISLTAVRSWEYIFSRVDPWLSQWCWWQCPDPNEVCQQFLPGWWRHWLAHPFPRQKSRTMYWCLYCCYVSGCCPDKSLGERTPRCPHVNWAEAYPDVKRSAYKRVEANTHS